MGSSQSSSTVLNHMRLAVVPPAVAHLGWATVPYRDRTRTLSRDTESAMSSLVTCGSDSDAEAAALAARGGQRRHWMMMVLVLIFITNQACRALLFYLVDFSEGETKKFAINRALNFNPAEYGILATLGFTVPFMVASLGAGVLADGVDRLWLGGVAALLWSASTAGMASACNYWMVMGLRVILGVAQAATNPASYSLISELFPEAIATVNSVYGLGIYLGGGIASLGAEMDERLGWRATCLFVGLGSAAISLLSFFLVDPRKGRRGSAGRSMKEDPSSGAALSSSPQQGRSPQAAAAWLRDMFDAGLTASRTVVSRNAEAVEAWPARWLLLASSFRFCSGLAILVWLPSAMHEQFPSDIERFAVYNSLIKAFAGGASSLAGGVTADVMRRRGFGDRAGALFCAGSAFTAALLWYPLLAPSVTFDACMGLLLLQYLVAESWLGPAIAALQSAVAPERRGAAQGVFSSLTALGNVLPVILGLFPPAYLAKGLQISVALCYGASGLCFFMAARTIDEDPPPQEAQGKRPILGTSSPLKGPETEVEGLDDELDLSLAGEPSWAKCSAPGQAPTGPL